MASQNLTFEPTSGSDTLSANPGFNGDGFLFDVETWLAGSPWRPAASWAVIAAGFSSAWGLVETEYFWRTLILALLLVDVLWGGVWYTLTQHPATANSPRTGLRFWLPYLRPGSPAARLLGWEAAGPLATIGQRVLASLGLALLVSWSLGVSAMVLTGVSFLVSVLAGLHRRESQIPLGLLHALATIGLPWMLGLWVFGYWSESMAVSIILPALWTIHSWGAFRMVQRPTDGLGLTLLGLAQAGIVLLFILGQAPIWVAVLVILFLPTWLAVAQGHSLHRVPFWWLSAMLVSALIVKL